MSGEGRPEEDIQDATGIRVAIATASWHFDITEQLLASARRVAEQAGADLTTVARVPGSMELPVVVQQLAGDHDAVAGRAARFGERTEPERAASRRLGLGDCLVSP